MILGEMYSGWNPDGQLRSSGCGLQAKTQRSFGQYSSQVCTKANIEDFVDNKNNHFRDIF